VDATSSLGAAESSLGDAESSLGDAKSLLGDAKGSLGDAKSSLGDAKSSLGDAKPTLSAYEQVVLTMNRCGLGDADTTTLAEGLTFNRHTADLSLQHNAIGDEGGVAIGVLLSANPNITHLDLSWNNIRARGADGLAHGLKENISLNTLLMRWNGLGSPGGVKLAKVFYLNQSLTAVDISANRLGAEAALVIAEALKTNRSLTSLDLNENPLGEDGMRHLMAMLVINRTLETLELKSCNVGKLPAEVEPSVPLSLGCPRAQLEGRTAETLPPTPPVSDRSLPWSASLSLSLSLSLTGVGWRLRAEGSVQPSRRRGALQPPAQRPRGSSHRQATECERPAPTQVVEQGEAQRPRRDFRHQLGDGAAGGGAPRAGARAHSRRAGDDEGGCPRRSHGQRCESCEIATLRDCGWEIAHEAVSRHPPNPFSMQDCSPYRGLHVRHETFGLCSIVQEPSPRAKPQLSVRFAYFTSRWTTLPRSWTRRTFST
jgi:hypothetical protein